VGACGEIRLSQARKADRSDDGKSDSGRDIRKLELGANPKMFAGSLDVHNSSGTWGIFGKSAYSSDSLKWLVVSDAGNVRIVLLTDALS